MCRFRSLSMSPVHSAFPLNSNSPRIVLRRANSRRASLMTCVFVFPEAAFIACSSSSPFPLFKRKRLSARRIANLAVDNEAKDTVFWMRILLSRACAGDMD